MENFGNKLYQIINSARVVLFDQGELAELTYNAFDNTARMINLRDEGPIQITFPVGLRPDNQTISSSRSYQKNELLQRYQFLAFHQLAINAIIRLVTIIEAMLGDALRAVILKYPQKLGKKMQIAMEVVLQASTIEDIHLRATDTLLNDLSYKSPAEFAKEVEGLLGINLLECPAFHRYVEVKATRDIYIHNQGIANEIYIRKAGTHVRVRSGMLLPVNIQYFLQSYEACLQFVEWLEKELHDKWHSSDHEDAQKQQLEFKLQQQSGASQAPMANMPMVGPAPEQSEAIKANEFATVVIAGKFHGLTSEQIEHMAHAVQVEVEGKFYKFSRLDQDGNFQLTPT